MTYVPHYVVDVGCSAAKTSYNYEAALGNSVETCNKSVSVYQFFLARPIQMIKWRLIDLHELTDHQLFSEGTSKMTKLSAKWATFSDDQKAEYKAKASEGMTWVSTLDQKKKVVRELIAITEENVSTWQDQQYNY